MRPADDSPFTGPVAVPGAELHVRDSGGRGTPVVLLHPGSGSADIWEPQYDAFVAAGMRVVAYSRRGHGESSPIDPEHPGSASDDLLAMLDARGLQRVWLLGAAGGAIYASEFAVLHPERVQGLVLVASLLGVDDAEWKRRVGRVRPPATSQLPPEFVELGPSYRAADPAGVERWVSLEREARGGGPLQPQPVARFTWASLTAVGAPTLIVAGGADLLVPTPLLAYAADRIPGADFVAIPDAGHAVPWERPAEFNAIALDFMLAGSEPH